MGSRRRWYPLKQVPFSLYLRKKLQAATNSISIENKLVSKQRSKRNDEICAPCCSMLLTLGFFSKWEKYALVSYQNISLMKAKVVIFQHDCKILLPLTFTRKSFMSYIFIYFYACYFNLLIIYYCIIVYLLECPFNNYLLFVQIEFYKIGSYFSLHKTFGYLPKRF